MSKAETFTGHQGLEMRERLIFERDTPGKSGVDLPDVEIKNDRLGGVKRKERIGLPGLSEPEVVRHYTRLSQKNYAIDAGMYPLGSCTMKHNPRLNEAVARYPGFAQVHPLQPQKTVQGALEAIHMCAAWLMELCGMPAVAMSPAAGAHGELCGVMAIRAALEAKGEPRKRILVPESAHGTNPATARMCGYDIDAIPADDRGRVDLEALKEKLDEDVAGIMLTNPNTCGLFESDIVKIAEAVHDVGAYFYCDGANFNAIVGRVKPGDLGIDCMHINLHKTFSTPHGGGGPGSGPVVFSEALAPYAPVPYVLKDGDNFKLIEHVADSDEYPFGRMKGFHGQFTTFVRALTYMMSMGRDGLKTASGDAVLNANYVRVKLSDVMTPAFDGLCMHEVLFSDRFLKGTDVSTLDMAKAMIDEGVHPMTIYFPLVVHGAMLIEPTETESKATLDQFIGMMRSLVDKAKSKDAEFFKQAPRLAPRRRLDETTAARNPVLRWRPEQEKKHAAE